MPPKLLEGILTTASALARDGYKVHQSRRACQNVGGSELECGECPPCVARSEMRAAIKRGMAETKRLTLDKGSAS